MHPNLPGPLKLHPCQAPPLYLAHALPAPTSPSLGYGSFGGLYVREMIVCEKCSLRKRPGVFQALHSNFSGKRGSRYLWSFIPHVYDSHLRVTPKVQGSKLKPVIPRKWVIEPEWGVGAYESLLLFLRTLHTCPKLLSLQLQRMQCLWLPRVPTLVSKHRHLYTY